MRLLVRLLVPLLIALAVLVAAFTPLADKLIERWFRRDVEMRSELIYDSVDESLNALFRTGAKPDISALFERIAQDERIMGVGLCQGRVEPTISNRGWPGAVTCAMTADSRFHTEELPGGRVLVSSFPMAEGDEPNRQLVIVHNLNFIESRSLTAKLYLTGFLALLSAVAASVTLLMTHLTLRGWMSSMRGMFAGNGAGPGTPPDPQLAPVISEIRQMMRDLETMHEPSSSIRVEWSPETLRKVLDSELPGVQVMVVSNREPYIHNTGADGKITVQRPASGVVTALEPIMRACGGTWIAHGSGLADRAVADIHGRVRVPPEEPAYTLKRIWLSEEEQDGYYYGLANEGIWPLCHISFVRPVFRETDWQMYESVNRKFADAVAAEAKQPDPLILIQDYHFSTLPRLLRERLPQATIVTFWHIPWPNAEVFGICPWREAMLNGLLGSSVVGFHTQLHCNNFMEAADRFIECHIDREDSTISVGGHTTLVRPYPISIAWPPEPLKTLPPPAQCREAVLNRFSLPPNTLLAVGVERFDFTKGIPDRFKAVGLLLENHPEWIGRFVLVQIAAPTRSKLSAYQGVRDEAEAAAADINARFGRGDYRPVILVTQHHEPEQVFELFRAADLCIVNSLHDGMNLVAKEFIASRDDNLGVLVLSTFTGASRELMEALIVNPFDARSTSEAMNRALKMPPEEQANRMRLMRALVSENNVYYWAARMLLDAARLRKRQRLESTIASATVRAAAR